MEFKSEDEIQEWFDREAGSQDGDRDIRGENLPAFEAYKLVFGLLKEKPIGFAVPDLSEKLAEKILQRKEKKYRTWDRVIMAVMSAIICGALIYCFSLFGKSIGSIATLNLFSGLGIAILMVLIFSYSARKEFIALKRKYQL